MKDQRKDIDRNNKTKQNIKKRINFHPFLIGFFEVKSIDGSVRMTSNNKPAN